MRTLINIKSSFEDIDEKGVVKIRVSAFGNKDSYGDIMDEKAFNQTINVFNSGKRTRVKHLHDHKWDQLLGLPIEITKSSEGLDIVSKMNLDKQIAKDVFSDYKFMAENGDTLEHSIGYVVKKEVYSKEDSANYLKEVDLKEYSTLSFLGANSETPLLDIKALIEKGELTPESFQMMVKKIEELEAKINSFEQENPLKQEKKEGNEGSINLLLL